MPATLNRAGELSAGGLEQVSPLPPGNRAEERASQTGRGLLLARSSWIQDLLAGVICLGMWALLYLAVLLAVAHPLGTVFAQAARQTAVAASDLLTQNRRSAPHDPQVLDLPNAANDPVGLVDLQRHCPPGLIDLDGRCVLGEEIQVHPPRWWRKR